MPLASMTIHVEAIRLQNQINALPEIRVDDPESETRMAERHKLMTQLAETRERQIAALEQEDQEAQAAMARNANTDGWTPELRAFRELGQQTSIARYVTAAAEQREIREGPEAEYNKEVLGTWAVGDYPIEMLLQAGEFQELPPAIVSRLRGEDDDEQRALITGTAADAGNLSFIGRLFSASDGAYLGASYPAVGPGRHSYPVVSGSTVATVIARGTAEVAAGGLSIQNADPERIQHSYEVASVDELQMPGIAAYLADDLRGSLMAGLDVKVLTDLLAGLTEVNDNTTMTLAKLFSKFGGAVNGAGARNVNEVRILASNESYAFAAALSIANVGHFFTLVPHDRFRSSQNMPDHADANHGHGIAYRTGAGNIQRLIVPVWRRAQLLRDTGRLQLAGGVTFTGVMFGKPIIVNSDLHQQLEFTNA